MRTDPYYWLMDRENPEVTALLDAENEYLDASLDPLRTFEDEIYREIKGRIEETNISVPVRRGPWWYFERTREGLSYPISCRVLVTGDATTPPTIDPEATLDGEQVLLDENVEANGHDYLSVGVFAVSPDDRWVAVGTDFDGNELHRVTIRPIDGQAPVDDVLEDVYYGFAWSSDNRHVFFTRVDDAMRPWQVWRHELGTDPERDVLILQEDDPQFNVTVGRSRDDAVIVALVGSSTSTEVHFLDAASPTDSSLTHSGARGG